MIFLSKSINYLGILFQLKVLKSMVPFEFDKTKKKVGIFGERPLGFFVGHFSYPYVYLEPILPY